MAKLPASVKVRHGEVKKEPDAEEAKGANCRDTSLPIVRRCKSVVSDWWLGELAAAGVSLICLVGIFAVLATFDNHQIPDFYYGLTLNAVISFLATAAKASLMVPVVAAIGQLKWHWFRSTKRILYHYQVFDEASRGPFGAAVAVWLVRWRSLATVGAIVTVLLILVEPFAQQLVTYRSREAFRESNALAPRALTYEVQDHASSGKWADDEPETHDLSQAIFRGVWADKSTIEPSCPSGNCTWPPFHSLAWCSKCRDATAEVKLEGCKPNFDIMNHLGYDRLTIPCTVSMKTGFGVDTFLEAIPYGTGRAYNRGYNATVVAGPALLVWLATDYSLWWKGTSFGGIENPMVSMAKVELSYDPQRPLDGPFVKSATECALSACIHEYDMSVSAGTPSAKVLRTDYGALDLPPDGQNVETVCWKANATDRRSDITPRPQQMFFDMCGNAFIKPLDLITEAMGGNVTIDIYQNETNKDQGKFELVPLMEDLKFSSTTLRFTMQGIGFDKTIENIGSSLTALLHSSSNDTVPGRSGVFETYVEVRWAWIAFPLVVMTSGIAFLIATILKAHWSDIQVWKSSNLPILCQEWAQGDSAPGAPQKLSALEHLSKQRTAELSNMGDDGDLVLHSWPALA